MSRKMRARARGERAPRQDAESAPPQERRAILSPHTKWGAAQDASVLFQKPEARNQKPEWGLFRDLPSPAVNVLVTLTRSTQRIPNVADGLGGNLADILVRIVAHREELGDGNLGGAANQAKRFRR